MSRQVVSRRDLVRKNNKTEVAQKYETREEMIVKLNGQVLKEGIDYTVINDEIKFSDEIKKELERKGQYCYEYYYNYERIRK